MFENNKVSDADIINHIHNGFKLQNDSLRLEIQFNEQFVEKEDNLIATISMISSSINDLEILFGVIEIGINYLKYEKIYKQLSELINYNSELKKYSFGYVYNIGNCDFMRDSKEIFKLEQDKDYNIGLMIHDIDCNSNNTITISPIQKSKEKTSSGHETYFFNFSTYFEINSIQYDLYKLSRFKDNNGYLLNG